MRTGFIKFLLLFFVFCFAATIFFPPGGCGSRENARRSSCQSNLKQIGLGFAQYTQDYDDKLPLVSRHGSRGWSQDLQPYIKSWQMFQCPSTSASTPETSDYFYNPRLAGWSTEKLPFRTSTIMGGDGPEDAPLSSHLSQLPPDVATNENSFARRHLETGNYLFADGHVKSFKPKNITLRLFDPRFDPSALR